MSRLRGQAENVVDHIFAAMFSDAMSYNLSILERDIEVAQSTTTEHARASPKRANPVDGTAINSVNPWLRLDAAMKDSGDWPNSKTEQATSVDTNEWVENWST